MINGKRFILSALQITIAFSTLLVGFAGADAGNLYKWTDEQGEVHYSDVEPNGTQWELVTEGNISVIPTELPTSLQRPLPPVETGKDDVLASFDRAIAERRQRLIVICEHNRGVDCADQVDTELDAERIQAIGHVIRLARPPTAVTLPR